MLPSTAQTKPQGGEVVAVGEGKAVGKTKVDVSVKVMVLLCWRSLNLLWSVFNFLGKDWAWLGLALIDAFMLCVVFVQSGAQVVYSKYAGTEVEFDGTKHLILKDDDIVGILETDDIKDLKPLNDRVLIKVFPVLIPVFGSFGNCVLNHII